MSSPMHCPAMSGRGLRCPTSRLRRIFAPPATQRGISASEDEELPSSSRRSMLGYREPSSWARLEPRSLARRISEGADKGACATTGTSAYGIQATVEETACRTFLPRVPAMRSGVKKPRDRPQRLKWLEKPIQLRPRICEKKPGGAQSTGALHSGQRPRECGALTHRSRQSECTTWRHSRRASLSQARMSPRQHTHVQPSSESRAVNWTRRSP